MACGELGHDVGGNVVQSPGLSDGTLELVGVDVVDAHRVPDATGQKRHALLPMAVFHGIPERLDCWRAKGRSNIARRRKRTQLIVVCLRALYK